MTKKKKETNKKICSICGFKYEGYGNNAEPINDGICCDTCNIMRVIPARIKVIQEREVKEK